MSARQSNLFLLIGFIAVVVIVVGVGALIGVGLLMKRQFEKKLLSQLSPQQQKELQAWTTTKFRFDPEALKAEPFSEATVAAAKAFVDESRKLEANLNVLRLQYKDMRIDALATSDTAELDALLLELAKYDSLIAAFKELVARPDYEIDAIAAGVDPAMTDSIPGPHIGNVVHLATLLRLKIGMCLAEGKIAEALETAEAACRGGRCHEYSTLISQLIAANLTTRGAEDWYEAVSRCEDAELLREALKRMRALRAAAGERPATVPLMVVDHVGTLREAVRHGLKPNIQGLTGPEIMGESMRVQIDYLEKIALPAAVNDPGRRAVIQDAIQTQKEIALTLPKAGSSGKKGLRGGPLSFSAAMMFALGAPNSLGFETRIATARCRLDLLILETARTLYRLEKGREPEKSEDLVPEYVLEVPKDVFAPIDTPYAGPPLFYSIGPDAADDKARFLYDPTNGTITPGDLFFPAPGQP